MFLLRLFAQPSSSCVVWWVLFVRHMCGWLSVIHVWMAEVFRLGSGSAGWSGIVAVWDVVASAHCLVRTVRCVCSVGGYEQWLMAVDVVHLRMIVTFCSALVFRAVRIVEA